MAYWHCQIDSALIQWHTGIVRFRQYSSQMMLGIRGGVGGWGVGWAAVVFQGDRATLVYYPVKMLCQYVRSLVPLHWCLFIGALGHRLAHLCLEMVLHTNIYFIHDSRAMQEIFRCSHNSKIQYFIEPFLIRSVRCKCEYF